MSRSHFVPQFYLRNFSNNGKSIGLYNIQNKAIISNASIKKIANVDDLYGEDQKIEKWLCEKEGIWSKIIKDIIESGRMPKAMEDYVALLYFVTLSDARTQKSANYSNELLDTQMKTIIEMERAHGVHKIDQSIDLKDYNITWTIPNYYSIKNAFELVPIISDLEGALIINHTNKGFITTDNPIVKYNQMFIARRYYRNYGYGHMGIQIFLPLNPIYCLCIYDSVMYDADTNKDGNIDIKSTSQINEINKLSLLNADKCVFFNNEEKGSHIINLSKYYKEIDSPIQKFGDKDHIFIMHSIPSVREKINFNFFKIRQVFKDIPLPPHMGGPLRPS